MLITCKTRNLQHKIIIKEKRCLNERHDELNYLFNMAEFSILPYEYCKCPQANCDTLSKKVQFTTP